MGVQNILLRAGSKLGLDPSVTTQRNTLLRYLNEAAMEIYDQADFPDLLDEKVFKVNGNQEVTFPAYFGQIRAAREYFTQIPWHINHKRPRFNWANWRDMWRNYRIVGKSPLQASIRNESVVQISVQAVESPPIIITLNGSTEGAAAITETITMDATLKMTTNNFTSFKAIRKDRVNSYDVIIKDIDDLQISLIPNDQVEALYIVIDVSTFPFLNQDVNTQAHYLEFLFKKALPWFSDDGQEFPAPGYDNVLVEKICQLYYEEMKNVEMALAYDQKATRSMTRKLLDTNRSTEDCVAFVPNGHDALLPTLRRRRRGLYGYPYGFYGVGY